MSESDFRMEMRLCELLQNRIFGLYLYGGFRNEQKFFFRFAS